MPKTKLKGSKGPKIRYNKMPDLSKREAQTSIPVFTMQHINFILRIAAGINSHLVSNDL